MKRWCCSAWLLVLGLVCLVAVHADGEDSGNQNVATFSIVAYDPTNGDLGVAVSSKVMAVGTVVPWARSGRGAIATQAWANTTFGPRGLALLGQGKSARETLDSLIESDSEAAQRQLAIVDLRGGVAVHTGVKCMAWAGSKTGKHHSCQGNILAGEKVVVAMDRVFTVTRGELAERLMAALQAGQKAGGDSRGRQSAALLVVRKGSGYGGYDDRYIDLRVDDHATPVAELSRIFRIKLGWVYLVKADRSLRQGKLDVAARQVERSLRLSPKLGWSHYLKARLHAMRKEEPQALESLRQAIQLSARFRKMLGRDPIFRDWLVKEAWKKLLEDK